MFDGVNPGFGSDTRRRIVHRMGRYPTSALVRLYDNRVHFLLREEFWPKTNDHLDPDRDTWHGERKRAGKAIGELGLPYGGYPLNDPACFPLFELAQRYDIPVFFHTGFGGPNPQGGFAPKFRIALSDPLLLEDVAIRFPKMKIVIMHMGWPYYDHALYMLWAYENVYFDTATVNWILGKELFNRMLREAVETVGSDRILFGSDQMVWPQMITPAIESIRDARFLSDQYKRNILGDNARRLLKIAN